MNPVRIEDGDFEVDATYLAEHLRLDPRAVGNLLRNQRITARCERGEGADAGRYRLSFRLGASRLSLVVDETGKVLRRTTIRWPVDSASNPRHEGAGEA
ncbi:MAG TPA: DUF6522 family protein [Pararhizobium sp.]|nr:DUF6522 family protein [Pararhizobium sp.]